MGILNHLNILVSANLLQAVILIGSSYWGCNDCRRIIGGLMQKILDAILIIFMASVLVFVWFFPTFGRNFIAEMDKKSLLFSYGQRFPEFQCFTFFCISIVPYPIQ